MKRIDAGPEYGTFEFPDEYTGDQIEDWFNKTLPKQSGEPWRVSLTPPEQTTPPTTNPETPPPPEEDRSTIGESFERGLRNLQKTGYGFLGLASDLIGADSVQDWATQGWQGVNEEIQELDPEIGTYKNVDSIKDAWTYGQEMLFENLPMLAPSLITGGVGAAVGKKLSSKIFNKYMSKRADDLVASGLGKEEAMEQAAKEASNQVNKRVAAGAMSGATPTSMAIEGGASYADIYDETGEYRPDIASAVGMAAGTLDALPAAAFLNRTLGSQAGNAIKRGLISRVGRGGAKQALLEAPTEGLQEVIQRMGLQEAGGAEAVLDSEGIEQVINAVIAGGLVGGGMGAVGGIFPQSEIGTPEQKETPQADYQGSPQEGLPPEVRGTELNEEEPLKHSIDKIVQAEKRDQPVTMRARVGDTTKQVAFPSQDWSNIFAYGKARQNNIQDFPESVRADLKARYGDNLDDLADSYYNQSATQIRDTESETVSLGSPQEAGVPVDSPDFLLRRAWKMPRSQFNKLASPFSDSDHKSSVLTALKSGLPVPETVLGDYTDTREAAPVGSVVDVQTDMEGGTTPATVRDYKFKAQDGEPTISDVGVQFTNGTSMFIPNNLVKRQAQIRPEDAATPNYALAGAYSNTLSAVENSNLKTGSPQEWQQVLDQFEKGKGLPPNLSVRKEEIDWLDLRDWVNNQSGTISREDMAEYIRAHSFDLNESIKSDIGFSPFSTPTPHWENANHRIMDLQIDGQAVHRRARSQRPEVQTSIPGESEFVTIRHPLMRSPLTSEKGKVRNVQTRDGKSIPTLISGTNEEIADKIHETLRETHGSLEVPVGHERPNNTIAHVRMQDRQPEPGADPDLEVLEIQSDLHQRSREQQRTGREPEFPFAKNWPELATKRATRYAAENGYQNIIFPDASSVPTIQRWQPGQSNPTVMDFYDKRIRKAAEKLAKKYNTTLKRVPLASPKRGETATPANIEGEPMFGWKMEITPEARQRIMEAQPYYAKTAQQHLQDEQLNLQAQDEILDLVESLVGKKRADLRFANLQDDDLIIRGMVTGNNLALAYNLTQPQATLTGFHESWHLAENLGLVTPKEQQFLRGDVPQTRLKSLIERAREEGHPTLAQMDRQTLNEELQNPSEVIAYATEAMAWYDIRGHQLPNYGGTFNRAVQRVLEFMRKLGSWLRGRGFNSPEDVLQTFMRGKMARRTPGLGPFREQFERQNSINYAYDSYFLNTEGPVLRRWGDKSVVKDRDGRLRTMYHATPNVFRAFERTDDIGFHFGTIAQANNIFEARSLQEWTAPATFTEKNIQNALESTTLLQQAAEPGSPSKARYQGELEILNQFQQNLQGGLPPNRAFQDAVVDTQPDVPPNIDDLAQRLGLFNALSQDEIGTNWNMLPVYLDIRSPLELPDLVGWDPHDIVDNLTKVPPGEGRENRFAILDPDEGKQLSDRVERILTPKEGEPDFGDYRRAERAEQRAHRAIREVLQNKGYDGIIYKNIGESIPGSPEYSYIAFEPQQIRSQFNEHLDDMKNTTSPQFALFNRKNSKPPKEANVDVTKDINWFNRSISTIRHVASRFPEFAPVYWNVRERDRHRTVVAQEAAVNGQTGQYRIAELNNLKDNQKRNVFKALELVRHQELDQLPRNNQGLYEITNPDIQGLQSQPGETITLSPVEGKAVERVAAGVNYILEDFRQSYLLNNGYSKDITTQDLTDGLTQLRALRDVHERDSAEYNRIQNLVESLETVRDNVQSLENMKDSHYMPLVRFGDRGLTVHRNYQDDQGRDQKELVGLWTFESSGLNRLNWKRKWGEKQKELQRQYPSANGYEVSNKPFYMTHDKIRREVGDQVWNLDMLASMLSAPDRQAYGNLKQELLRQMKSRSFNANFLRARKFLGYDTDIQSSYGQFIAAASTTSANLRFNHPINNAVNDINPTEQRELSDYAKRYTEYSSNPQEEWSWFRNMGFFWYLGANASSAALQWSTLPTFTASELSMVAPSARVGSKMTQNFTKVLKNMAIDGWTNKPDPYVILNPHKLKLPDHVKKPFLEAFDRGILKPQRTPEQVGLTTEQRNVISNKFGKHWRKVIDLSATPFNTAESIGRMTAFLTVMDLADADPNFIKKVNQKYRDNAFWNEYIRRGRDTPDGFAEFIIDDSFGGYGKANRAPYNRHVGAALFQFNTYPQQMIELMSRMMGSAVKDGNSAAFKALVLMSGMLLVMGGLQGLPGAEDMKEIIEAGYKGMTGHDIDLEKELRTVTNEVTGSPQIAEMAARGPLRMFGIDMSQRASLGSIPAMDIVKTLIGVPGDPADAMGVPGSLTIGAAQNYMQRRNTYGDFDAAANAFLPTSLKNIYQAYKWNTGGVKNMSSDIIVPPAELKTGQILAKALGFNPSEVAAARESARAGKRVATSVSDMQTSFYTRLGNTYQRIRQAHRDDDQGSVESARREIRQIFKEIREWNKGRPPHEQIQLDKNYLRRRVERAMKEGGARLEGAPERARREISRVNEIYNFRRGRD